MKLATIGWIYIILGSLAVIEVIHSAFNSRISFNIIVFMLPVGIGLLNKKMSSFKWSLLWSCIMMIIIPILILVAMFGQVSPRGMGISAQLFRGLPSLERRGPEHL